MIPPPPKRRRLDKPKPRRTQKSTEEISFDFTAREDYLTGFRKRKQARIKHARDEAVKLERLAKIESRKQIRDQRQKDLEAHVKAVDDMVKKATERDSDDEDEIVGDGEATEEGREAEVEEPKAVDPRREDEYIDEEKYTTVTVEPMDGSEPESDGDTSGSENEDDGTPEKQKPKQESTRDVILPDGTVKKKRIWTKEKPATSEAKKKAKPKKFRYESKVERRASKAKQKAKNNEAARTRKSGGRS